MAKFLMKQKWHLAAMLAMAAQTALAGLGYTVTTTVERADETEKFSEKVLTQGKQARIDFLDADGSYLVTNDGGKTFVLANRSEAYCSSWTTTGFFQAAGNFLKKAEGLANAELHDLSVKKVLEEPGGVIEGFDTTHIRVVSKYGAKARILFLTMEYAIEEVDDLWMTSDLELPFFEQLWLESNANTGFTYMDELSEQRLAFETGPVLKMENVVTLRNVKKNESEVKKETTVVSNLREITAGDVPPGHFDLPRCEPVSRKMMEKEATRMLKKHVR
ncbi:MAG: hypothetical protein HKN57_04575 [Xanthomonadales bacterium]|nr:hypothetical protein [Gammaproteobacteria bacterium]NND56506.1 hypothetical protein [Xanthomonadales bacterium]NNK52506.1 hypothetical protein [Xanthomonadales bacterium]